MQDTVPFLPKNIPKLLLSQLEEDLVRFFYGGKPLIETSSMHCVFKFKQCSNVAYDR